MITQLVTRTRHPYDGAVVRSLTFAMTGSQYLVKKIEGLGPVKSEVAVMDNPVEPGRTFMNARDVSRNIVLTIGFEPDFALGSSVEGLRRAMYAVLPPSTPIELVFTDSVLGEMTIQGYVETHEPNIFAQDPEVQISIICPMPYFKGPNGIVTTSGLNSTTFDITYPGDVPVGFTFDCDITGSGSKIYLANMPTANYGYVRMDISLASGDHVYFSTVPGNRGATTTRSASTTDRIGYIAGSLTKLKLQPGINHFTTNAFGAAPRTNTTIKYEQLYGSL